MTENEKKARQLSDEWRFALNGAFSTTEDVFEFILKRMDTSDYEDSYIDVGGHGEPNECFKQTAQEKIQLLHDFVFETLEELFSCREIGTIEELQALKKKAEPRKPICNDLCTCPSCSTHNEVIKKRRNTVVHDTVYCWHCGQAIECQRDIDLD